jgi:hypothetical protein
MKRPQSLTIKQKHGEYPYYANIQRILEYLIAEFKKIKNHNSEIYYTKAVVSEDDDIRLLWHHLFWHRKETEDITVWPEYTAYAHEEYRRIYGPIHFPDTPGEKPIDLAPYPTELEIQSANDLDQEEDGPSTIAHGVLSGINVIEGESIIKDPIRKAIKFLLLQHYYPQQMPDSDTFLKWFPHFASQADEFKSQLRYEEDEDIVYWYEFLLKLTAEHGSLIDGDKPIRWQMQNIGYSPIVQEMQTDILTASINALEFLLDKTKKRSGQIKVDVKKITVGENEDMSKCIERMWKFNDTMDKFFDKLEQRYDGWVEDGSDEHKAGIFEEFAKIVGEAQTIRSNDGFMNDSMVKDCGLAEVFNEIGKALERTKQRIVDAENKIKSMTEKEKEEECYEQPFEALREGFYGAHEDFSFGYELLCLENNTLRGWKKVQKGREQTTKDSKTEVRRRGKGVLNDQVAQLLRSSHSNISAPKVTETLNLNYAGVYKPTSASAVTKTQSWKNRDRRKAKSQKNN